MKEDGLTEEIIRIVPKDDPKIAELKALRKLCDLGLSEIFPVEVSGF